MKTKSDFEDILLLPEELKELRQLRQRTPTTKSPSQVLFDFGLVLPDISEIDENGWPVLPGTFSISEKGIRYLNYQKMCKKRTIGKYLASKWIDFLALVVAVIALIISIVALNNSLPLQ